MGDDDIDRKAILARRAAFVSAALAAVSCNKAEPPPKPPPDPVAPVRPVEVDPGGGEEPEQPQVDASVPPLDVPPGIDELDRVALERFAKIDPQGARIVELRWFGGSSVQQVADVLGVSTRTVERGWRAAAAWLRMQVSEA